MLAIRMQRTGRKGHAQFRMIVQDKRFSPTSGRVVVFLGSYDPHSKSASVDKEKAAEYLKNGAQPTEQAARILKSEGVKLPSWVKSAKKQKRSVKHPEKLRRNRPASAEAIADAPKENEAPAQTAETAAEADKTNTSIDSETPAGAVETKEVLAPEAAAEPEVPAEEVAAVQEKSAEASEAPADETPTQDTKE